MIRRTLIGLALIATACRPKHDSAPPREVDSTAPDRAPTADTSTIAAAEAPPPSPAARDSARGVIAVSGAAPLTEVRLRPAGGGPALTLRGPGAAELRNARGLDVRVEGTLTGRVMRVSRYAIRSASGIPAVDGTLSREGGELVLTTADGARHTLVDPPPVLADHVGARIWIAGPLDRPPVTFGVLEP